MARPFCLLVYTQQGTVAFGPYKTTEAAVAARQRAETIGVRCSAAPLLDPRDAPNAPRKERRR